MFRAEVVEKSRLGIWNRSEEEQTVRTDKWLHVHSTEQPGRRVEIQT